MDKLKESIEEFHTHKINLVKSLRRINFRLNAPESEMSKYDYLKVTIYRQLRKMEKMLIELSR